ncbi:hypothetical protein DID76_03925 [Candidatus Marinamargulisbacteria bacterium SCGC AG-414-C22]|nr:hypothetical protein DID76_03925 [Candidatus Marinamargulisbacteria bacterium SCGC AG-414-C22]
MIGLKVYADQLAQYHDWDVDYFEVYIRHINHLGESVTLSEQLELLKPVQHRVMGIHGGILYQGVNFFDRDCYDDNKRALDIVFQAVDHFPNCRYMVFHPGMFVNPVSCSFSELYSWIRPIQDNRFMLEVEPFLAYQQRYTCPLYRPEDWLAFKHEINKDIVVDTGHALITARIFKLNPRDYLRDLIQTLNPKVIHLAMNDDRGDGYEDSHLHLTEGSFDLRLIESSLQNRLVTIEVNQAHQQDLAFARSLLVAEALSV